MSPKDCFRIYVLYYIAIEKIWVWGGGVVLFCFVFLPKFKMNLELSGCQIYWWAMRLANSEMQFNEGIPNRTSAPRNTWL